MREWAHLRDEVAGARERLGTANKEVNQHIGTAKSERRKWLFKDASVISRAEAAAAVATARADAAQATVHDLEAKVDATAKFIYDEFNVGYKAFEETLASLERVDKRVAAAFEDDEPAS